MLELAAFLVMSVVVVVVLALPSRGGLHGSTDRRARPDGSDDE